MRFATIDIGTNTVLLLILEVERTDSGVQVRILRDDHAIARLGEGVDRTGVISEAAYERFSETLQEHAKTVWEYKVDKVTAVATSAIRDAQNRQHILDRTSADAGIDVEILSGADEARWTYYGAIIGLTTRPHVAVIDIGGGSTEVSFGVDGTFSHGVSMNIGAVRITERCLTAIPATATMIADATRTVHHALRRELAGTPRVSECIAVAGTPTSLAGMHLKLPEFDASRVNGHELEREWVQQALQEMLVTPASDMLQLYPSINKARVDILPAGTLILAEAMAHLRVERVRVSTRGLRYGIALREIEAQFATRSVTLVE